MIHVFAGTLETRLARVGSVELSRTMLWQKDRRKYSFEQTRGAVGSIILHLENRDCIVEGIVGICGFKVAELVKPSGHNIELSLRCQNDSRKSLLGPVVKRKRKKNIPSIEDWKEQHLARKTLRKVYQNPYRFTYLWWYGPRAAYSTTSWQLTILWEYSPCSLLFYSIRTSMMHLYHGPFPSWLVFLNH
jgi:hypothetical protein